jgi:protein TonB
MTVFALNEISMPPGRLSTGTLALVLLAHAAALLLALISMPQATMKLASAPPLSVSLIELQADEPRPEVKPVPPRPQTHAPVLSAARPDAPPLPAPVIEPPRPVAEPVSVAAAAAATPAAVATPAPPLVEPRLDADYLNNPKPPYPSLSRRLGEQGSVHLRVFVNADGSVARLELKRSSGFARLDQSALHAVQSWRFVPARQGSQPVAAWVVVPIQFTLGS